MGICTFFIFHSFSDMPRKLNDRLKEKRAKKANRKIEEAKDLQPTIKNSMIEGLYRIGWDALKITRETGLPRETVYRNIKHFEELRTCSWKAIKLDAIAWGRKYGSRSAAKKFDVGQDVLK